MAKRLIGTATTNEQGIATLSYVGEGAGMLNIQAETSDGELCSLPLVIYDCLLLDKGLASDYNTLFNKASWFTRETDGTTVSYTNTGSATGATLSNRITLSSDFVIEFTLQECTKAVFRVDRYGTETSTDYHATTFTDTGVVRIEILSDKTIFYLDNEEVYRSDANSSEEFNFEFRCSTNDTINFKYTDLKVYSI